MGAKCPPDDDKENAMRNSYLKEMDAFMAQNWKDTLERQGFFPLRDCTEFVRLTGDGIMQIIICSGFVYPEIQFYSQTLSEYLWCNYRSQTDMTSYALNHYIHPSWLIGEPFTQEALDMNQQMEVTLKLLDSIHTAKDILTIPRERELTWPERPCLWYDIGDAEGIWKALEHSTCARSAYYPEDDVRPEKLTRDYWRSWKPMMAFVARECLAKEDLQPLADFAEESRAFNLKYLKRYMPWLLA